LEKAKEILLRNTKPSTRCTWLWTKLAIQVCSSHLTTHNLSKVIHNELV